ncbi:ABC transporter ATP-binding protein [Chitinophaga qingshengii]|uniref:ATP-binding cassette domain-containing protein n=1 Tax=Chitinophaga qingshengii TaxID=1569794 RepID=A0ABR7TGT1_9BACT|nr:ATP-binding cassette domain-containing protein [Chitinophaga qingshengii]MBC9929118.1 ATP-binding cassette domain-containing protein [Chitinophaga qingshengii]
MLHLRQFKKYYHHRLVLSVEELILAPGIYWVQGANGSGKSTLLKSLAGLLHFEGEVVLNNACSLRQQTKAYRRLVNFADAEPLFPPYLSGRNMAALFVEAKNGDATRYIEQMNMLDYIDDPISTYSSGMLKKLSLVLAFIGQPALILLDEPLITMDEASLQVLFRWIREGHEQGVSFLLASHQAPMDITDTLVVASQTIKRLTV